MGKILIYLDDEYEALLYQLAEERYPGDKDGISKVVRDALDKMRAEERQKEITEFIDLLRKGLKGKYMMYKSRDEIYD